MTKTQDKSDNLRRYLNILNGSSRFRKVAETFKDIKTGIKEEVLNDVLETFFIPVTEENGSILLYYLLSGSVSSKCTFHVNTIASEKQPAFIKIDQPSITLQVTDDITVHEWRNLWRTFRKLKNNKTLGLPAKKLQKPYKVPKQWSNIDLLLEIYRMHLGGASLQRIHKAIPELKGKLQHKDTIYTLEDARRLLKQTKKLLDSIK